MEIFAKALRSNHNLPDTITTSQFHILEDLITLVGIFGIAAEQISTENILQPIILLTNLLGQLSTAIGLSIPIEQKRKTSY